MIVGFLVLAIVLLLVLILLAILFPAVMRRLILGLICLVGIAYVVGSNLTEKSVQATNYRPSSIEAASPDPATNDVLGLAPAASIADTEAAIAAAADGLKAWRATQACVTLGARVLEERPCVRSSSRP